MATLGNPDGDTCTQFSQIIGLLQVLLGGEVGLEKHSKQKRKIVEKKSFGTFRKSRHIDFTQN